MCIIFLAYQQHPDYRLILLSNRDEFYERPTKQAHFWENSPNLLAGRDLKGKGTWLGITKTGRIGAITNVRDPSRDKPVADSRGKIVTDFLCGEVSPKLFLDSLSGEYNDFNLFVGDTKELYYFNSIKKEPTPLSPGIYGLSNHQLDTPWPKVRKGKKQLNQWLQDGSPLSLNEMIQFMQDSQK